jgi:hypothetical protein
MLLSALILLQPAVALTPAVAATDAARVEALNNPPPVVRWAGRQTVLGTRNLPVLGDLETRTDLWVLARVDREGDRWVIHQTTCAVRVADVMGVSVDFPAHAVERLPPVAFTLTRDADGIFQAPPWSSGWDAKDYDRDGWGGLTLTVSAPMCSGRLAVTSHAETTATVLRANDTALELDLAVRVGQQVLETDGWCLRYADKETDDKFTGKVRYEPLSPTATCKDVVALPPVLPPTP